jgi:hypothetical protein
LLCIFFLSATAYGQVPHADTADVKLITSDVELFFRAFDEFKRDTTANPFTDYISDGSEALNDFFEYVDEAPRVMKSRVMTNMQRYEAVRTAGFKSEMFEKQIKENFMAFRAIYPDAEFPDIHFVIGLLNRGGISTEQGIIIGLEKFCGSGNQDPTLEDIPLTAVHGLIFFNQKPAHTGYTLLRQSIIQGSSEFLVSLFITEKDRTKLLSSPYHLYGERFEETIVKEFLREKDSNDFSRWLYNRPAADGRPSDLGNWIGFRITEAYYHSFSDKVKAIDDILKINDFERFLTLSGYAEPFRN